MGNFSLVIVIMFLVYRYDLFVIFTLLLVHKKCHSAKSNRVQFGINIVLSTCAHSKWSTLKADIYEDRTVVVTNELVDASP